MNKIDCIIIIFVFALALVFIFFDYKLYQKESFVIKSPQWQANVVINNHTPYAINITGAGAGNGIVQPNSQYNYSSTDVYNTKELSFAEINMIGNLSFGQNAGVFADRGWQENQTIVMNAVANDEIFVQDKNGGKQILEWNQFENGGNISLTFQMISY